MRRPEVLDFRYAVYFKRPSAAPLRPYADQAYRQVQIAGK